MVTLVKSYRLVYCLNLEDTRHFSHEKSFGSDELAFPQPLKQIPSSKWSNAMHTKRPFSIGPKIFILGPSRGLYNIIIIDNISSVELDCTFKIIII
jgi:hypothetical protein